MYEITIEWKDGCWTWERVELPDFHAAAAHGLDRATALNCRLVKIERVGNRALIPTQEKEQLPTYFGR